VAYLPTLLLPSPPVFAFHLFPLTVPSPPDPPKFFPQPFNFFSNVCNTSILSPNYSTPRSSPQHSTALWLRKAYRSSCLILLVPPVFLLLFLFFSLLLHPHHIGYQLTPLSPVIPSGEPFPRPKLCTPPLSSHLPSLFLPYFLPIYSFPISSSPLFIYLVLAPFLRWSSFLPRLTSRLCTVLVKPYL